MKEDLIKQLSVFGTVEVLSIGDHLALLMTGKGFGSLTVVNTIMMELLESEATKDYILIQSMKNDDNYLMVTLNKS